jgi:P4 family phage/plasmid primase-like protien
MCWAEEDNYQMYHEYIKQEFNDILVKSFDGSSYYVAKALYTKYQDRFVYNSKSVSWYEFKKHRWFKVHDGYTLKLELSEAFANEYLFMINKLNSKASKVSGVDKDDLIAKASKIQKIVSSLMNITFKEKIMKEAIILFTDPDFDEKLDENYDLIGFNNGVYDLEAEEFRVGRPDDYISKSTNVDYYPFNISNPYVPKMFKFFAEILPIESVRKHLMLALCSCVAGHNKDEKLRIATGSGGNGKSLLFNLVQQALGNYYISCPITIITRKRNSSNQASPELLRIKGARCGCFQETDDGEKLNVGIMKEITGNDRFMVRGLFADAVEIKPQIKFFLACNQLPALPSVDGGVKRRLENILFGSKFTENPTKPNEFLIDNSLKQKIKDWAPTFASYLIHLYVNEYKKLQCLIAPKEVKLSTESYIAENDFTSDYVLNRLVYTGDKSDSIGINVMYEDFKGWYKDSRDGNSKAPSRNEFQKLLIDKIGEGNSGKWRGFTFNIETSINKDSDSDNEKTALDI